MRWGLGCCHHTQVQDRRELSLTTSHSGVPSGIKTTIASTSMIPQKKEEKMPPRMCWKGGRGHRPDLGVSITFSGPESVPATLHPLLAKPHQNKTSCWNEAAVVQKQLNTTQPGPQGSHSVHRPLNPALGRTVPLVWFCFCRKLCVIPGALLQLSDVFLKVLL